MTEEQDLDLVEQLADEFANRLRAGERPSIKEYTDRHPELAEIIRDTFEALAMMENMAPGSDEVQFRRVEYVKHHDVVPSVPEWLDRVDHGVHTLVEVG